MASRRTKVKKFIVTSVALLLVIGLATSSGASPITFTDTTLFTAGGTDPSEDLVSYGYGTVNKLDGAFDFVRWTHHFEFYPPAQEVLSGTLTVSLTDDLEDPFWQPFEFALGFAEDWTFDLGEVDTGEYSYSVTASYLEDGEFSVTLFSLLGDFYIDWSDLSVTYTPVPIPSAILLLASGLAGLAGFGRRRELSAFKVTGQMIRGIRLDELRNGDI